MAGDIFQPAGSRGLFRDSGETDAGARLAAFDIHPTAPLPGAGGMQPADAAGELEQRLLAPFAQAIAGLEGEGVEAARRATRLQAGGLEWQRRDGELLLSFRLPAGAYATVLLNELITTGKSA